jgi:hypothetical protein
MCMQVSEVRPYQKWHWAGDEIVFDPTIPASRRLPTGCRRKVRYPIDIREFLGIAGNAVVKQALHRWVDALPVGDQQRFFQSRPGNFDFRAYQMRELVGKMKYIPAGRAFDAWQFPEETLALAGGDCEDLAFLLAALLEAAGISPVCIRVALGQLVVREDGQAVPRDHAWIVYQNERGVWEIIEPLAEISRRGARSAKPPRRTRTTRMNRTIEYIPHFVFNSQHLWRVRNPDRAAAQSFSDYLGSRRFWLDFKPEFAAKIHNTIFDAALRGMNTIDLLRVKAASLVVDVNVLAYDPRDHFDFAYVSEGWARVQDRLATHRLDDFALAAHAVADFYAHTVYGEFGLVQNGQLLPYNAAAPRLATTPSYDFQSCSLPGCTLGAGAAAAHWSGQLISGQWWRGYTTFPDDLQRTTDFKQYRRCLPDHDTIGVDSADYPGPTHRYEVREYQRQFGLRYAAAVTHIAAIYGGWKIH